MATLDPEVLAALAEAGRKLDKADVPKANRHYFDTATQTWWHSDANGVWHQGRVSNGNEE